VTSSIGQTLNLPKLTTNFNKQGPSCLNNPEMHQDMMNLSIGVILTLRNTTFNETYRIYSRINLIEKISWKK
jgi:hypothetical protein